MAIAQRRQQAPWHDSPMELAVVVTGVTLFFAAALTRGPELPLMLIAAVAGAALAIARPHVGFYLLVFSIVLGDLRIGGADAGALVIMFQSFHGIGVTPLEMLLIITAVGVALKVTFDNAVPATLGELMLPIAAFIIAIGLGIGIGLSRGADMEVLRLETKGFLYIPLVYLIVLHTLRSPKDLSRFLWVFVVMVNIMAAEDIFRYFTKVKAGVPGSAGDLAFAHEDAIFCAAAIIILFSQIVWSASFGKSWKSFSLLILPIFALTVMKRRAGIVAMDAGILLLCIVLLKDNLRLFFAVVPVAVVVVGLLLAVTWNEPGGKGQFARSFRTITGQETTARDQSSDEYRAVELANVRLNIQNQPLTGLGFGHAYTFYLPLVDLSAQWELYPYVPHNSVMWIWMKAGIVGFLSLVGLFAVALMRSTQLTLQLEPGLLKVAAFSFGAIALMFLLYSWADLGLISARALALFGIALGGIATVSLLARQEGSPVASA
jgi:O-antigen ligase